MTQGKRPGHPGVQKVPPPQQMIINEDESISIFLAIGDSQAGVYPLNVSSALFQMLSFLCIARQIRNANKRVENESPTPAAPGDLIAPHPSLTV